MAKLLPRDDSGRKMWPKSSYKIIRLEAQYAKYVRKGRHAKCLIILDKINQLLDAEDYHAR